MPPQGHRDGHHLSRRRLLATRKPHKGREMGDKRIAAVLALSVMVASAASADTGWAFGRLGPSGWVIAIDGLTTRGDRQIVRCKLHQFGDTLFAATAVTSASPSSYNAHRLMQTTLSETRSLSAALEVFERRAMAELERLVPLMPEAVRQERVSANLMLRVIVAAVEDGIPRLRHRMITFSESGQMRWEDGVMPASPNGVRWSAGATEAQDAEIRRVVQAQRPTNTIDIAIATVKAAGDLLDTVGPPYSVAMIDASGPHWLNGYDQCSNAQP